MTIWTELTGTAFCLKYVDAGGLSTRSLQAGDGYPVVMLHGTSGHLEAFVRNLPTLSKQYECHAIDMLGHGYTDARDEPYRIPGYVQHLLDYLDASGIDRAHFIGESLGGWVAARLAADYPDRVGWIRRQPRGHEPDQDKHESGRRGRRHFIDQEASRAAHVQPWGVGQ